MKKIFVFAIAAMLLAACGNSTKEQTTTTADSDSVKTAEPDIATVMQTSTSADSAAVDAVTSATALPNHTSYNGKLMVSPQRNATVTVTMGGKIHSTPLMPGIFVSRGSVIAVIDNPAFIDLQRDFMESRAQLAYLESEYNRQSRLSSQEAASQKHFQQSKADYMTMKTRYQASAMQLRNMGVSLAGLIKGGIRPYFYVHAPISGYVANLKVNLGKYLQTGDPICDIIDKGNPMLCLTAYEKDLGKLSEGNRVQFRVNGMGKRTFYATVSSISQEVDDTNRSIQVYARIKGNNPRFRPGMYVTAHVENR
jgi:cobalt-zinc-cadmium efflux system membrane fusion protein